MKRDQTHAQHTGNISEFDTGFDTYKLPLNNSQKPVWFDQNADQTCNHHTWL